MVVVVILLLLLHFRKGWLQKETAERSHASEPSSPAPLKAAVGAHPSAGTTAAPIPAAATDATSGLQPIN